MKIVNLDFFFRVCIALGGISSILDINWEISRTNTHRKSRRISLILNQKKISKKLRAYFDGRTKIEIFYHSIQPVLQNS